eukprot:TRINITY_DN39513_c0_g1_i1.p1 TRINITY_DN39513_c0_g1~~TRINITY_DN39513_c0_g1_i1.p1  ORF type:complete len:525 (-),score=63.49 TRINITY_DN39513_c0_g1_i1:18-1592(-)
MQLCWCVETVQVALCTFVISIYAVLQARELMKHVVPLGIWTAMRQVPGSLRWLMTYPFTTSPDLDPAIRQQWESRKASTAHAALKVITTLCCFTLVIYLVKVASSQPTWMSTAQVFIIIFGATFGMAFGAQPTCDPRLREVQLGVLMLSSAAWVWTSEHRFVSAIIAHHFGGVLSMMYMTKSSAFWNTLLACTVCVSIQSSTTTLPNGVNIYIFEMQLTLVTLIAATVFERLTLTTVMQGFHLEQARAEKTACMSLLDMVCDVVVQVTGGLTFVQDSRSFAALLMATSGKTLKGLSFCDFIASEDERDNLKSKLIAVRDSSEISVGTCQAILSDSIGSPVRVEIFFVNVPTDDEDGRYLLGIRELADAIPAMQRFIKAFPRQRTASQNKGTTSFSQHVELGTETVRPSELPKRTAKLRFPKMARTTPLAVCNDLLEIMSDWNMQTSINFCCNFHAYTSELKTAHRTLAQAPCRHIFPDRLPQGLQCQTCGLLVDRDTENTEAMCIFCETSDLRIFEATSSTTAL